MACVSDAYVDTQCPAKSGLDNFAECFNGQIAAVVFDPGDELSLFSDSFCQVRLCKVELESAGANLITDHQVRDLFFVSFSFFRSPGTDEPIFKLRKCFSFHIASFL